MHVFVTGSGGFIGRSVVEKARSRGWKVTAVARRQSQEADVVADLRYPINNWETPDAVIHLAGGYAGCGMRELVSSDILIARNLLQWGMQAGVRKWIFASAAEVYGDIDGVAYENYPCHPVTPYGKIKLQIEEMFKTAGLAEVMICRIGEVYGPTGRILKELSSKLCSGFCPWPGNGKVKISFIHADDAAEALVLACEHSRPGLNIYNINDNEPATWGQFLDEIAAQLAVRSVYYLPKPLAYCYAAGSSWMDNFLGRPANITPHLLRLLVTPKVMSSAHLREELGFVPRYTNIHIGLKDALDDQKSPNKILRK
jgi:nucleoside-diphosphate-sugar epimerase